MSRNNQDEIIESVFMFKKGISGTVKNLNSFQYLIKNFNIAENAKRVYCLIPSKNVKRRRKNCSNNVLSNISGDFFQDVLQSW